MKFLLLVLSFFSFTFFFTSPVKAAEPVQLYFFWGDGCPHCAKEKPFLQTLESKYNNLRVYRFEVWKNPSHRELMVKVAKRLGVEQSGVPLTIIGDQYIVGYLDNATTGKSIERLVKQCSQQACADPVGEIVGVQRVRTTTQTPGASVANVPAEITVPLFGTLQLQSISLPVLTILIAGLDGFNPCAMWTLVFLISLLLGMHDKKKMWILGSAFIIASALVYFMFMAAWLHVILFIGFIVWIRAAVALLAVGGGIYNLREYLSQQDATCKVTRKEERKKVFDSLKRFTQEKRLLLALGGIVILAAAVNIIELICSAGFPVVYTQILALNNLPTWQYYVYLLFYIIVFMADDLIVFFVSMKAVEVSGISTKYTRVSHLIGGVLMVCIGILLLYKPEWLMFG